MKSRNDDRITEYLTSNAIPEHVAITDIPIQSEFYKIPKRFGSIPVDELPIGCDKDEQYYKIYPRISLPFQKAGKIQFGFSESEPNRLFWGDNLHVMRMLPSNSIDLIYIDPPFFSGRNYNIIFGDQNEIRSFSDVWEGGIPGYLIWMNARLLEMKRLLKKTGSIYVHLDWHASHYVKVEMDKIFGYDNFRGEIIWSNETSSGFKSQANKWIRGHDVILYYTKTDHFSFNKQYGQLDERTIRRYDKVDKDGRKYKIYYESDGRQRKVYLDKSKGRALSTVWNDIPSFQTINNTGEYIGYPTQKPEKILERIIKASSNEHDVVADFFCGGGTTPCAAQKLNRRWIACDQSKVAVAITQGRIQSMYEEGKMIQNRLIPIPDISIEYWGTYEIPQLVELSNQEFRYFIISAYGGRISTIGNNIHGFKGDTPIFVGNASQVSPVTKDDVINFAKEIALKRGKNRGIMLAWSFAPSAKIAVEKLLSEGDSEVELIQILPIQIESPQFREHISKISNEYDSFLVFILPPEIRFRYKHIDTNTYLFDVSESVALNAGAKIINVQWDFDYKGRFTPTKGFALGKDEEGNPLYKVEYKFQNLGNKSIACRVQDDIGGEKIFSTNLGKN